MATDYKRVLLKLSGEAFRGKLEYGIDLEEMARIGAEISSVHASGIQLGIVIGGGNILRGSQMTGIGRVQADYMGMLATMINGLALQDVLESAGIPTRVMTALATQQVAEPYIRRRALRHLEKGRVLIFAGGTGLPRFTTDTTAAVRAMEIDADVLLKATQVDGVYSADPRTDPNAKKFTTVSYSKVLADNLRVMDQTAIAHCKENDLPVIIFSIQEPGSIKKAIAGEPIGTLVN